jgi:hypothetical protein
MCKSYVNAFVVLKNMKKKGGATVEHYIAAESVCIVSQLIANFQVHYRLFGAHGGIVVEALCHKPEGCGFDSRLRHLIFSLS